MASAAEFSIIALKQNKQATIIGYRVAGPQTKHQQPFDPDFLSELFKVIAENDSRSI